MQNSVLSEHVAGGAGRIRQPMQRQETAVGQEREAGKVEREAWGGGRREAQRIPSPDTSFQLLTARRRSLPPPSPMRAPLSLTAARLGLGWH
eukprot:3610631-Rhodomonas_salina.2